MLLYASLHPEWDCANGLPGRENGAQMARLLEAVMFYHYPQGSGCFAELEELGVFLGNGGFQMLLLQPDPVRGPAGTDLEAEREIAAAAAACICLPLWYCLGVGGALYILCCYPRLRPEDSASAQKERLMEMARDLQLRLMPAYPRLRILISDLEFGESGVFRTYSHLHHASEFYDFLARVDSPVQLDAGRQLQGAFAGDMSVYRQFAVSVGEQLSRAGQTPSEIAGRILDTLLENCAPSMESLHHHVQLFMLTLTDYLGSAGLVDVAYIRRRSIVARAMGFEREDQLRRTMEELMGELRQQNQMLRKLGRQKRVQAIRDYAEDHISDPELTVTQLSDRFGLSKAQVTKQFRYYYGVTLHQFLQQRRVQLAQQLLAGHPDWSMREIAAASGYSDLSTMYRAFHAQGDVTPGALRDSLRQDVPAVTETS